MSDVFSLFDEAVDAQKFDTVDEGKGSRLSTLIRASLQIDEEISQAEKYLKDLKFKKRKVNEEDIPALMEEMGMESVTVDGNKISLRQFVHARIPDDRRDDAYAWLRSIGEGDIIKNDVTCSFGKGEDNLAGDVVGLLQERGFDPKTKTHVHPSTLKAFVKERVTDGKPIDLDMFGAYINNAAEIRRKA